MCVMVVVPPETVLIDAAQSNKYSLSRPFFVSGVLRWVSHVVRSLAEFLHVRQRSVLLAKSRFTYMIRILRDGRLC